MSAAHLAFLTTTNPRTGETIDTDIATTTEVEVDLTVTAAAEAQRLFRRLTRRERAAALYAVADALDGHADELARTADEETGLGMPRLTSEVARSSQQLRLFGDAVVDGEAFEPVIDHADAGLVPAAPDIRRILVPLPVVAVFGSSNFPFAFSVAGGDVAAGLAAGASVVVKAHSSHPLTSRATHAVMSDALKQHGVPPEVLGIVYGTQAGIELVLHPLTSAVGFTGSLGAATALQDAIRRRSRPIPFFGELSSLNPLLVTRGALEERGESIAEGCYGSITTGSGQFCTKPGVLLVPVGAAGDALVDTLVSRANESDPLTLLNERIAASFGEIQGRILAAPGARLLTASAPPPERGFSARPTLIEVDVDSFEAGHAEECFGPLAVIVRYAETGAALRALRTVPNSLTATLHSGRDETEVAERFVEVVAPAVGRLVFDGFPTGVRVSWAQHHGGPWPATTTQFTSVGVGAMRRFLRPLAFQGAPAEILPEELRDVGVDAPVRRTDGIITRGERGSGGPAPSM